jgi:DNA replication and repair protein RecF
MNTALTSIRLRNFRSYRDLSLDDLPQKFVVLTGPNGAGKTNLLEAVSLLSPGKGLRGADLRDLQNSAAATPPWAISAHVRTPYGDIPIGTGKDPETDRRIVRIKGETAKSQMALSEYLSCLWLTPQMDRLFIDAASARRRFLDRMIFAFDPAHAGRITRYEKALSQRSRLLKEGKADPAWLEGLEIQMAESGIAVSAARVDFVQRLQASCYRRGGTDFPVADLSLSGFLEDRLATMSALNAEEAFRKALSASRSQDAVTGGAAAGAHRTDLSVRYHAKNMQADQCSTGEQKALLIGLVLSHAELLQAERGSSALLLLDEVAAHLDEGRRAALFDTLSHTGGQVWITGTDENLFSAITDRSCFFHAEGGGIVPS